MIICNDSVIVVEETSRAKIDDIEKLLETARLLREHGILKQYLGLDSITRDFKIIVVLHAIRRVDSAVLEKFSNDTRRSQLIGLTASCDRELRDKLRGYYIELP